MKKLSILLFLFFVSICTYGQYYRYIVDPKGIIAYTSNIETEFIQLYAIQKNFEDVKKYNTDIALKLGQIELTKERLIKSLKEVGEIKVQSRKLVSIGEVAKDIADIQKEAWNIIGDNKKLILFWAKAEVHIASETLMMLEDLEVAITGGEKNLLDAADRTEIIRDVLIKSYTIRNFCQRIVAELKAIKVLGIWYGITGEYSNFSADNKKIADKVLEKTLEKIKD
jgi:hypothetical protein